MMSLCKDILLFQGINSDPLPIYSVRDTMRRSFGRHMNNTIKKGRYRDMKNKDIVTRRDTLGWMGLLSGMGAILAGADRGHGSPQVPTATLVNAAKLDWTPIVNDIFPPGLLIKPLFENKERNFAFNLVRYPAGYREPRHFHKTCGHILYFLNGKLHDREREYLPGTFAYAPPKDVHGPFFADMETEVLFFVDGTFDLYGAES